MPGKLNYSTRKNSGRLINTNKASLATLREIRAAQKFKDEITGEGAKKKRASVSLAPVRWISARDLP